MRKIDFLKPIAIDNKIRLGPNSDGGYIVYKEILNDSILITYGVGWDVQFEEHFNNITANNVIMFDPTMFNKFMLDFAKIKRLLKNFQIQELVSYIRFIKEFWKKIQALKKKNVLFINEGIAIETSIKYDTFENHLKKYQLLNRQILLKMDIEGNEYAILEDAKFLNNLENISQIIVEFHNIEKYFNKFELIINNLKLEYEIIHIHGNNHGKIFPLEQQSDSEHNIIFPDVVELTFVRRDKIVYRDIKNRDETYPIAGLDYPNKSWRKDYPIRFG